MNDNYNTCFYRNNISIYAYIITTLFIHFINVTLGDQFNDFDVLKNKKLELLLYT